MAGKDKGGKGGKTAKSTGNPSRGAATGGIPDVMKQNTPKIGGKKSGRGRDNAGQDGD